MSEEKCTCGCGHDHEAQEELTNIEIIVFEDEEGGEIEMEIVDEFDLEERHFVALVESIGMDDDCENKSLEELEDFDDDVNFFEVIKDENGEEMFDLVEDRQLLNKLADELENRILER
jgi:hypothetical protein